MRWGGEREREREREREWVNVNLLCALTYKIKTLSLHIVNLSRHCSSRHYCIHSCTLAFAQTAKGFLFIQENKFLAIVRDSSLTKGSSQQNLGSTNTTCTCTILTINDLLEARYCSLQQVEEEINKRFHNHSHTCVHVIGHHIAPSSTPLSLQNMQNGF